MKFTKIILGCMLLASTQVILADDLYRCGNTADLKQQQINLENAMHSAGC